MALVNSEIPLSLYIHWPWCLKKCPYCDFNSHARSADGIPEEAFIEALKKSFDHWLPLIGSREIKTVFFGGGTPSLMKPRSVADILEYAAEKSRLAPDAEVTLEANPGTAEYTDFGELRRAGVNRISLGIQSFQDEKLRILGRIHNSAQAEKAVNAVREHFENFNLDLMFALPGQTLGDLEYDLGKALSFSSTHLSYYQLTIEEGTYFGKHVPEGLPDEDTAADMLEAIERETEKRGFGRYEVSAYAKPGFQCRHNLNYWQYGDYIGIGPGAAGKITAGSSIKRTQSVSNPASWMRLSRERLEMAVRGVASEEIPFEFMLNALRLRHGVPYEYWSERTFLPFDAVKPMWERGMRERLLTEPKPRLCTTEFGWEFLTEVQELFL